MHSVICDKKLKIFLSLGRKYCQCFNCLLLYWMKIERKYLYKDDYLAKQLFSIVFLHSIISTWALRSSFQNHRPWFCCAKTLTVDGFQGRRVPSTFGSPASRFSTISWKRFEHSTSGFEESKIVTLLNFIFFNIVYHIVFHKTMSTGLWAATLPMCTMNNNPRPTKTPRTGQFEDLEGDETVRESDKSSFKVTFVAANHAQLKLLYTVSTWIERNTRPNVFRWQLSSFQELIVVQSRCVLRIEETFWSYPWNGQCC